jgi:tetratricopeptide (TPR) repeat protein
MARRKRLNLRLILVLSVVAVIVLVVGAYGAYKLHLHRLIIRINPVEAARKAEAAQAKGEFKAAERQLLRAISAERTPKDKAEYYYKFARLQLAWLHAQHDQMNDAEVTEHSGKTFRALEAAIVQDHTHVESQRLLTTFMRALAWGELAQAVPGSNTTNAIRDFRRAIELSPDNAGYHREYTRFLEQQGRVDEAVQAYEDAIAKVPNDGDLRIRYAALLVSKDRPGEAMTQIQEAIVRDPSNPSGNLALADRLLSQGNSAEALAALEKARQIDDSDYRVYGILSMAYRMQKQDDKALATLRDGLAVTEKKLAETPTTSSTDQQMQRTLEGNRCQLLALLGNSLLDQALSTPDEQARATLLTQAQEALDRMTSDQGAPGQREKLEGRLAFIRGNVDEAQTLLERAYSALGPDRYVAGSTSARTCPARPNRSSMCCDASRPWPTTPGSC